MNKLRHTHHTIASSHIALTHSLWASAIGNTRSGDAITAVDATCGNGYDSVQLFQQLLGTSSAPGARLWCLDVQSKAVARTEARLIDTFGSVAVATHATLRCQSHETFPNDVKQASVAVIAYNLGFLPGTADDGAARVVSHARTTVASLAAALALVRPGGVITAVAYRGHPGGADEALACHTFFSALPQDTWRAFAHDPINSGGKGAVVFSAFRRNHFSRDGS